MAKQQDKSKPMPHDENEREISKNPSQSYEGSPRPMFGDDEPGSSDQDRDIETDREPGRDSDRTSSSRIEREH